MKIINAFTDYKVYVTSPFGWRKNPFNPKKKQYHYGTDYGTNGKQIPLYAPEDATITVSKKIAGAGNYIGVKISRIKRRFYIYHLKSRAVKTGQKVKKGQLLGYVDSTGSSTGTHIHLGMKTTTSAKWLNPHTYNYQPEGTISTPKPTPIAKIHTVKKGDTLTSIAKKYKTTIAKIMKANPIIKDKNKINVGWKLKV